MDAAAERFVWRDFAGITARELHAALRLRCEVFVVEQACAFGDVDGRDPEALHLLAWSEAGDLAGVLRLLPPDAAGGGAARVGRVAVAPAWRGTGLGRRLMAEALAEARRRFGDPPVELSAQSHLEGFYAGLGFVRASADYPEDGIPHCDMRREAGHRMARCR